MNWFGKFKVDISGLRFVSEEADGEIDNKVIFSTNSFCGIKGSFSKRITCCSTV